MSVQTLSTFDSSDECPNGTDLKHCQGPDMDGLPCFECYLDRDGGSQ